MGDCLSLDERAFAVWADYVDRHWKWRIAEPKWWQFKKHREWKKAEPQIEWNEENIDE